MARYFRERLIHSSGNEVTWVLYTSCGYPIPFTNDWVKNENSAQYSQWRRQTSGKEERNEVFLMFICLLVHFSVCCAFLGCYLWMWSLELLQLSSDSEVTTANTLRKAGQRNRKNLNPWWYFWKSVSINPGIDPTSILLVTWDNKFPSCMSQFE